MSRVTRSRPPASSWGSPGAAGGQGEDCRRRLERASYPQGPTRFRLEHVLCGRHARLLIMSGACDTGCWTGWLASWAQRAKRGPLPQEACTGPVLGGRTLAFRRCIQALAALALIDTRSAPANRRGALSSAPNSSAWSLIQTHRQEYVAKATQPLSPEKTVGSSYCAGAACPAYCRRLPT